MGRRRKKHEEHENHERWLVSYADFITLLFAFFVVLYATSEADLKKQEELQEKIKSQFGGLFGAGSGSSSGGGGGIGELASESGAHGLLSSRLTAFPSAGSSVREVENHVQNKLREDLSEDEYADVVEAIRHDAYGVRIQLAASAIFPSGSSDLKEGAIQALEKIGRLLRDSNRKILIEGHTDDEPIRTKRYPSNWELSAARATKIARFLIQRLQVDPSRIIPMAYASNKPLVANDSPENRAKNRRIEIMIVNGSEAGL